MLQNPFYAALLLPFVLFCGAVLLYLAASMLLRKAGVLLKGRVSTGLLLGPLKPLALSVSGLLLRPAMALYAAPYLPLYSHLVAILFVVAFSWFSMRAFRVASALIQRYYNLEKQDNLEARRVATHLELLRKVLNVLIVIVAVSIILMRFDPVRQVGLSVLASAGIVGIMLGFAAQRSIATLIAGIQIAVTQPIRIDDVVIVENEWGRIEEITLTYVVVRIWDQRRLVVPISHFLEKPFQNWTRTSAELLGTVYLYTDYQVDVEVLRKELQRIVEGTQLWDGRVVGLQVTNATERTLELRALVSARNSSDAWDLRCLVREKLLGFLREHYPGSLPKLRIEGEGV